MAAGGRVQFRALTGWAFRVVVAAIFVCVILFPARVLFEPPGNDTSHPAIRVSAMSVVFFWVVAWPLVLVTRPRRRDVTLVRVGWTAGFLFLLLHLAIAFHVGHGWSHQAAWEHTRQVGGYGDGIYVNYLFGFVWLVDVIWSWAALGSYLRRPRWVKWSIASFMGFIVFNAAVVFGSGAFRVLTLIAFLVLGAGAVLHFVDRRRGYGGEREA